MTEYAVTGYGFVKFYAMVNADTKEDAEKKVIELSLNQFEITGLEGIYSKPLFVEEINEYIKKEIN